MDNDKKSTEIKKGRGRPPLSHVEKEQRRKESKRKYELAHPEVSVARAKRRRKEYCDITISILRDNKPLIDNIALETNESLNSLFLKAVEEKYNIKLTKD